MIRRWLIRIVPIAALIFSGLVFLPSSVGATSMRMVGYFWGADPDSQIDTLEYSKYTNIIYCQVEVTSSTDPTLVYAVGDSGSLASVTTKTHTAGGLIQICLIGGDWVENPDRLTGIMANSTYRNTLASNLATFVTDNSLDGVDIDWETSTAHQSNYNSFLSALHSDLSGGIISVTGTAEWANTNNRWFTTTTVSNYVDFVNLMMYDIHPYPEASLLTDVETYTAEWMSAGFDPAQLNLGIPAFGYTPTAGSGDYYNIIANLDPANSQNYTAASTPWTTSPTEFWWSGYNLNQSKASYAASVSLGGMMIYAANEDACGNAKSIIDAIYDGSEVAPSASTSSASNKTTTTATLNGNLSNLGTATSVVVSFEYGLNTLYGTTVTASESPMSGTGSFHANITGLTSGTQYHFKAITVGDGTGYGDDVTFTTTGTTTTTTTTSTTTTTTTTTRTTTTTPAPTYALTMAFTPGASGTATDNTDSSPYTSGSQVSITASPASGYRFVNWTATAGSFAHSNQSTTTFIMPTQVATITAHFAAVTTATTSATTTSTSTSTTTTTTAPPTYRLIMAVSPNGHGSAIDNIGDSPYESGSEVSITASANDGYTFVNWTANHGSFTDATAISTTFIVPSQTATVTAHFTAITTTTPIVTNPTVSIPPGGPVAGEFPLLKTLLAMGPVLLLLYFIFMPLIGAIKSIKSQGLGMGALKILVFYALGIILFIALFPQIVHLMYAIMTM